MYATLEEYQKIYLLGSPQVIPDNSFPFYSSKASQRIGNVDLDIAGITVPITHKLFNGDTLEINYPDYLIRATCAVATMLYDQDQISSGGLVKTSERVGSYSVSYNETGDINTAIDSLIADYISFTDLHNQLIYKGMR